LRRRVSMSAIGSVIVMAGRPFLVVVSAEYLSTDLPLSRCGACFGG
jgi:hypothetical protein